MYADSNRELAFNGSLSSAGSKSDDSSSNELSSNILSSLDESLIALGFRTISNWGSDACETLFEIFSLFPS